VTSGNGETSDQATLLKVLLKQRHLQVHSAFRREYDKVAAKIDRDLVGRAPAKAQFYRWLSGELTGLPYAHHCQVLEGMFPDWPVEQLFKPHSGSLEFVPEPAASGPVLAGRDAEAPRMSNGTNEIVGTYPYRSRFSSEKWWDLFSNATDRIDLLGYTLYFLPLEHPGLIDLLRKKCESGCVVRAAIADPNSPHVAYRDSEENQPITLVVRITSTLQHFAPLADCENFQLRYQDIPLYNSVFRFDNEMLVTPHLFATPGSAAPLMHLRRNAEDGMFSRFADHFDNVWTTTKSIEQSDQ
jgi:hypothetical protein